MSDVMDNGGISFLGLFESALDDTFGLSVEGAGRSIEKENFGSKTVA